VYKLPQRVRLQCKPLKKLVIFNLNLSDLPKVLANQKGLPSLEHVRIVYGITIPESMDSYGKFECVVSLLTLTCHRLCIQRRASPVHPGTIIVTQALSHVSLGNAM